MSTEQTHCETGQDSISYAPEPSRKSTRRSGRRHGSSAPKYLWTLEARNAFADGISSAMGQPYARLWNDSDDESLRVALTTLANAEAKADGLKWLRTEAERWVRAIPVSERKFTGGWRPSRFVDWVNSGRTSSSSSNEISVSRPENSSLASELFAEWQSRTVSEASALVAACESPIERLVVCAALRDEIFPLHQVWYPRQHEGRANPWWVVMLRAKPTCTSIFELQKEICVTSSDGTEQRHRCDVAMEFRGVRIAIEFDGHEFHERTKEQAQRDRSRDRDLTRAGWIVLRYTGSEISKDPSAVWVDMCQQMIAAADRCEASE